MEEAVKIKTNYIAALFLAAAAVPAFVYDAYINRFSVDGIFAPVVVNVEVAKPYMNNYCLMTGPDGSFFYLSSAGGPENDLPNAVLFTEINGEYIQKLFVKSFDKQNVLAPVDNITVFIGNKTFYYPKSIIETWKPTETEDGVLLQLPVEPYAASIIKPWINWYGDLNFVLKTALAFFANPFSLSAFLVCVLFCIVLTRQNLQTCIESAVQNHKKLLETSCLVLLLLFAFLLRIDGLTRHSSWVDELYSGTVAANPRLPWQNTFKDPGNPPLFYLLLRLWFTIFGWSEASGRMLSVLIGLAGIVSLYCFVKPVCGRKYAFLSAFLQTVNLSHIGYSNQMRAAILMMALAPLVSRLFFSLMEKGGVKRYVLYTLAGAALANTHYYGILLIVFNFFYWTYTAINGKRLFIKKIVVFLAVNAAVALSVLPFFIITAFQKALLDSGFNTWISRPGMKEFAAFAGLSLVCLALPLVKRRSKTIKNAAEQYGGMFEYTFYAVSFIFITAYIVSLKRPMLTLRYLSICLPFIFAAAPVVVFGGRSRKKPDALVRFLIAAALINISSRFGHFGGGSFDVYKEAQEYISADAAAHSMRAAQLNGWDASSYYRLPDIPSFTGTGEYDVVYVNPLHIDSKEMLQSLSDAGLDHEYILWIRTSQENFILKKYLAGNGGD